ncbi:MAG: hypothetical protein L6R28_08865 [Planctomycetes bacterium]|nr:hypothetical protein [Planctomycetota bacterium]
MQIGLPCAEIPQDFEALDIPSLHFPFKTYYTKDEILAPYHPNAKPPVVSEAAAWVLLVAFAPMAGLLAAEPLWKALRAWKRPQYTLRHLLLFTLALAGTLLGGVGIWQAAVAKNGIVAELEWAERIETRPDANMVVTFHRCRPYGPHKLSIYARDDNRYRHEKTYFSTEDCWFDPPFVFRYRKSDVDGTFLSVTHRYSGTGCYKEEAAFLIQENGHLDEVRFDDATDCLQNPVPFSRSEGVWKPPHYFFNDEGLAFEFGIWKWDDANCCPTAGYVTGTYKIIRHGGRLRLMVDQAARGPVEYDR